MADEKQKTWLDLVDEYTTGEFVKFEDGDEKVITIASMPKAGPIEFKQQDGSSKWNDGLQMEVFVDGGNDKKNWTVTSKSLMGQMKGITVKEGLGANIVGCSFRVSVAGTGVQRKYFVKLVGKNPAK